MLPEEQKASAPADDIDTLLNEFSSTDVPERPSAGISPKTAPESPSPKPAAPPPELTFAERLRQRLEGEDAQRRDALAALRGNGDEPKGQSDKTTAELAELRAWAEQVQGERIAARDRADADRIFGEAATTAREVAPWLPDDYARNWLKNEAETDAALGQAWTQRHDSPEAATTYRREVARALKRLSRHVATLPDPGVSEDRSIVTASLRNASVSKAPEAKPVSYSNMSDADFANQTEKQFGFRPF